MTHSHQWEHNTLFIGNLPFNVQLKELWKKFKQVGRIRDIILPKRKDKLGRRYGFIKVFNGTSVDDFIRSMDGITIHNSTIRVHRAKKRQSPKSAHTGDLNPKHTPSMREDDKKEKREYHKDARSPSKSRNNNSIDNMECVEGDKRLRSGQNSHLEPSLELGTNENFENYLKRSVVVETWKENIYLAIRNTMDLLGFGEVDVKEFSAKSFLVTFLEGTDLEEVDMDFVGLGFLNVKDACMENLIIPRKAWVEIRGIPIPAWSEDNFILITKEKGTILDLASMFTDDCVLHNPRILIETFTQDFISWSNKILVDGKEFLIHVSECFVTEKCQTRNSTSHSKDHTIKDEREQDTEQEVDDTINKDFYENQKTNGEQEKKGVKDYESSTLSDGSDCDNSLNKARIYGVVNLSSDNRCVHPTLDDRDTVKIFPEKGLGHEDNRLVNEDIIERSTSQAVTNSEHKQLSTIKENVESSGHVESLLSKNDHNTKCWDTRNSQSSSSSSNIDNLASSLIDENVKINSMDSMEANANNTSVDKDNSQRSITSSQK